MTISARSFPTAAVIIACLAMLSAASSPRAAADIAAIDDTRLTTVTDDTGDWLHYGRTYANQRFSPLKDITTETVSRLVPKWIYQTGEAATFQTSPIVADGIMYLSAPMSHVIAVDARSGLELWRYDHKRSPGKLCCGPANRGVAIGYGKVYVATVDARLIALDRQTGQLVWDTALVTDRSNPTETAATLEGDALAGQVVSGSTGVGAASAPLVVDGLVITGITGVGYGLHIESKSDGAALGAVVGFAGRYGRPGFLAAYDAATGKKVWQFDTTQAGWEGKFSATTPDGFPLSRDIAKEKATAADFKDAWLYGGGSIWQTPAVDLKRGMLYFGVGNPSPQAAGDSRPGDNLYTSSLVALDIKTGKLKWHYQQVPHDVWGYDVASPPVLFDLKIGPSLVPAVSQASKLGWVYVHDRRSGKLLFKSDAFVPQKNLFAKATPEGTEISPGVGGGANWSPTSLNPVNGHIFVAGMHMPTTYRTATFPTQGDKAAVPYVVLETQPKEKWGTLTALNLKKAGQKLWQVKTDEPLVGGVMATAGGVVFSGEGSGVFSAYHAETGEKLWSFQCGAGVNAPPVSFAIDGHQYVAVAAGGSRIWGYRQGGAVIVFGLPDSP